MADGPALVGDCAMDEKVRPSSAMEGRFTWTCAHGRIAGRVQRAPTNDMRLQALEYRIQEP